MEGLINTKSGKRFVDQPCSASGPMEPPDRTHPLPTMSRNASRWPWQAAHRVGVIPSSSGAFSSFRVASFSTLRYPSRAARWYRSFMAAPYPSSHSVFGSMGVVEGFPWPAPEFGSFQTRAEGCPDSRAAGTGTELAGRLPGDGQWAGQTSEKGRS